jgi:hypothetical protein
MIHIMARLTIVAFAVVFIHLLMQNISSKVFKEALVAA